MKIPLLFLALPVLLTFSITACGIQKEVSIEEVIYDPHYMDECKDIFEGFQEEQVGYKGLFPGLSTIDGVKVQLGEAVSIEKDIPYSSLQDIVDNWRYDDSDLYIDNDALKYIIAYDHRELFSLAIIAEKYGCPQAILHFSNNDMQTSGSFSSESFNFAIFAYPSIGFEIFFQGFPVKLDQKPDHLFYFKPISLKQYLESAGNENVDAISWGEAVE